MDFACSLEQVPPQLSVLKRGSGQDHCHNMGVSQISQAVAR